MSTDAPAQPSTRRWWVIGGVLVGLGVLLAVYLGLATTRGIHATTNGHRVDSDSQVTIRFDLTRDVGREVTCRFRALDEKHATVGRSETVIPPSSERTTRQTTTVRTSSRALTGYVDECWYTGDED